MTARHAKHVRDPNRLGGTSIVALLSLTASGAFAQVATSQPDDIKEVNELVVTSSYIARPVLDPNRPVWALNSEDVSHVVVFLASDDAAFITGLQITVNGGSS